MFKILLVLVSFVFLVGCSQEDLLIDNYSSDPDCGIVGNQVWANLSSNDLCSPTYEEYDEGQATLENLCVNLLNSNSEVIATQYADPFGRFLFQNLPAGDCFLEFLWPTTEYFRFITQQECVVSAVNADGRTDLFTLNPGEEDLSRNAGVLILPFLEGSL